MPVNQHKLSMPRKVRETLRILENFCRAERAKFNLQQLPSVTLSQKTCSVACNALLDGQVLDYCKIFFDHKSEVYLDKIIKEINRNPDDWLIGTQICRVLIENEKTSFRNYRDKFVSHRDMEDTAQIPSLELAKLVCHTLHDYLVEELKKDGLDGRYASYSDIYRLGLTD
jgi:hypothetical protein